MGQELGIPGPCLAWVQLISRIAIKGRKTREKKNPLLSPCSSLSLMSEKYPEFYYENTLVYSQHKEKNKLKRGDKITQL